MTAPDGAGFTSAEITVRRYPPEGTVRDTCRPRSAKTGARSRLEALRTAEDNGWL